MSYKVIYDIETLLGCFTYSALDIYTKEEFRFVIHPERNDIVELYKHLLKCSWQIGFNNLNFDYPILHYMLFNKTRFLKESPEMINYFIHAEATKITEAQNNKVFSKIVSIKKEDVVIKQIDLFRVWHYNNPARSTSLKNLQVSMGLLDVQEMPIDHTQEHISKEDIDKILEYNWNDVISTYEFYLKSIDKIKLRFKIKEKYNIDCLNFSNGKLGEQLILKLYCDKTNKNWWDVKNLRTFRTSINLKDCIPDKINFKTEKFNQVVNYFKNKVITNTKGAFKYNIVYKGCSIDYGTGGIHGCTSPSVYESNNEYIIKTADVSSLYPNIPIAFRFTIEHLGWEFLDVYENQIVNVRMAEKAKPKNERDSTIIDGYKEAANITYGKSNDENSFLYDPLYTMQTTIAGQLALSMLIEDCSLIPDSKLLMINTDGFEILIPRKYESLYNEKCKEWENKTNLTLEFDEYSKMWIRDVNNYGSVTVSGKIKNKGAFEVDKVIGSEPAYHKDSSFRIVPLAVQEYFVHNIPIQNTIKFHFTNKYKENENKGILDFCGRQKFDKKSYGEILIPKGNDIIQERQQKITRYYVSNKGYKFVKRYHKGTSENIHSDYYVTIFNKKIDKPFADYDINLQFYINEAYKLIHSIESTQLSLF